MGRQRTNHECNVAGCASKAVSRGLCQMHYSRWRRHGDPLSLKTAATGAPTQFLCDAAKSGSDDCIVWPYAHSPITGYGILQIGKTTTPAHRRQCTLVHGEPPTHAHQAAHSCGNRLCVNPRHLRWATPHENAADQLIHGTRVLGERQGAAKLTREDVRIMRQRVALGESSNKVAADFGIGKSQALRIVRRQSWAWLD